MQKYPYILIVEDSPTQAEQLRYILEQNNNTVLCAPNGAKALELIKLNKPALIISDIMMPEMDGFELCKKAKDDPELRNIPFIILTSLSDPHDVIKGLQAGADNFLTKPYNEQFLISRVQYIQANQELRRGMISAMGIEIVFAGQKYFINSDRIQIIDLLLSTYENAIQKNLELSEANSQLTEMHQQLEMKNRELEKLDAEKNKFLGIAAHDIRNPVGGILTSSMILEEELHGKVEPDIMELISMMKMSADFVMNLINELLDVSIMESGNLQAKLIPTDITDLVSKSLASNKVLASMKNIKLNFSSPPALNLMLDRTKMAQVINNLISNAIKYSYDDKNVFIKVEEITDSVLISVQDEGQGIPAEEMERLFKPFPRISVQSTRGEKSTGLGLVIVRKIVEAHNGEVWANSQIGIGTTFYVRLPK
jgi:signal transduction histidine kinase